MNNKNLTTIIIFLGILVFLGYMFSNVLIYILLAIILAAVGSPLMQLLQKIKIKNWSCPSTLAATITLLVLMGVVFLGFYILIPFVIKEIKTVSSIDPTLYTHAFNNWLTQLEQLLYNYGFINDNEKLGDILLVQIKSILGSFNMSGFVSNLFSFAGAAVILIFSVIFLTFFALKDKEIFFKMIRRAIPVSFRENYDHILSQSRVQVVRYFAGVLIDNLIVGVATGLACYFANVPNALLIGIFVGIFNTIPYVGPFIALGLSLAFSITTLLPALPTTEALSLLFWKITIIYAVIQAIDSFLLKPVIFGKSVQVHPIEIFIITLLAGFVGGMLGMIFAVPAYSMIRIVVKEFFGEYYGEVKGER